MNAVERLVAVEEIKCLKARYFRLMDTKQWAELTHVFTEDAIFDVRAASAKEAAGDRGDQFSREGYLVGREVIMNFMRSVGGPMLSVHHGHMPEIRVEPDGRATGIWAMEDVVEWPSDDGPLKSLHGYGHYHDVYVSTSEGWKVKQSMLARIRVMTVGAKTKP